MSQKLFYMQPRLQEKQNVLAAKNLTYILQNFFSRIEHVRQYSWARSYCSQSQRFIGSRNNNVVLHDWLLATSILFLILGRGYT